MNLFNNLKYALPFFLLSNIALAEGQSFCYNKSGFSGTMWFVIFIISFILGWIGISKIYGYFFSLEDLVTTSPFQYWIKRVFIISLISIVSSCVISDVIIC